MRGEREGARPWKRSSGGGTRTLPRMRKEQSVTGIAKGTFFVLFGVGVLAGSAPAAVLQSGHADLGLGYEEGWHLHIHVEHGMVDGLEALTTNTSRTP